MPIPPKTEQVESLIAGIMARFGVPGAGVALLCGEDSLALGYGVCVEGGTEAVGPDTTFQLASCSKAYTATTAAILVDRGEIGWDDPVRKHLPEFQMHDEKLSELATLRDLLSMRLGYRNEGLVNWARNAELGVEFIFERLRYMEVIAGFRENFTYLNPAYTLMAEVIARRTGKPFVQAQSELLHAPLGQKNTFVWEGKYLPKQSHAFPHVTLEGGLEPLGEARCGGRIGESCVYSSANDARLWMGLHLGKGRIAGLRLVSQAAMDEMHRPHVYGPPVPALDNHFLAYGMGWQCRDTPNGPILLHEGGEFGVSTFTILDPLRRIGASVYANAASSAAVKSATYALIDLAAGREPRDWASLFVELDALDQNAIRGYLDGVIVADFDHVLPETDIVGSYFHPANGVLDVSRTAGVLEMQVRDGWLYDGELEALGGNLYRLHCRFKGMQAIGRQMNLKTQFFRDEQGIALRAPGFGVFRKLLPAG
jgi:CubicO group peptidase (beta-lactamase class C family)